MTLTKISKFTSQKAIKCKFRRPLSLYIPENRKKKLSLGFCLWNIPDHEGNLHLLDLNERIDKHFTAILL